MMRNYILALLVLARLYRGYNLVNIPVLDPVTSAPYKASVIATALGAVLIQLNFPGDAARGRTFVPGLSATDFGLDPSLSYWVLVRQPRTLELEGIASSAAAAAVDSLGGTMVSPWPKGLVPCGFPLGLPHLMTYCDLLEWFDQYAGSGSSFSYLVATEPNATKTLARFVFFMPGVTGDNHTVEPGQGLLLHPRRTTRLPSEAALGNGQTFTTVGRSATTSGTPSYDPVSYDQTPMNSPEGLRAFRPDAADLDYVAYADKGNHAVMMAGSRYEYTRIAGLPNGQTGPYDPAQLDARQAALAFPEDVDCVSSSSGYERFMVADTEHHVVRVVTRINSGTCTISTLAGTGNPFDELNDGFSPGRGGLYRPTGIANVGGTTYIVDQRHGRIRRIATEGQFRVISTFAGGATTASDEEWRAPAECSFAQPERIAASLPGGQVLYVTDSVRGNVRCIRPDSNGNPAVVTVMGTFNQQNPVKANTNPPVLATAATLQTPKGLATDPEGSVYVSDVTQRRIYRIGSYAGWVSHVAGSSSGEAGNRLNPPYNMEAVRIGSYPARSVSLVSGGLHAPHGPVLHFSDRLNHCIRRLVKRP
ncbi:MAG: hypothetical protein HY814_03535 [Candidatus Riflebacteria bacterium]|nr:hypothetical protein [Candidatus Riflebacteria bacterium]